MSHVWTHVRRPAVTLAIATLLASGGLVVAAPAAYAASPTVVVAEVYGGGGNSGATWRSDFVELFNHASTPVDLTGWKVSYWSAAGTTASSTLLSGTIAAGGRYLVKEADGANTGATALPIPDAIETVRGAGYRLRA